MNSMSWSLGGFGRSAAVTLPKKDASVLPVGFDGLASILCNSRILPGNACGKRRVIQCDQAIIRTRISATATRGMPLWGEVPRAGIRCGRSGGSTGSAGPHTGVPAGPAGARSDHRTVSRQHLGAAMRSGRARISRTFAVAGQTIGSDSYRSGRVVAVSLAVRVATVPVAAVATHPEPLLSEMPIAPADTEFGLTRGARIHGSPARTMPSVVLRRLPAVPARIRRRPADCFCPLLTAADPGSRRLRRCQARRNNR